MSELYRACVRDPETRKIFRDEPVSKEEALEKTRDFRLVCGVRTWIERVSEEEGGKS